MRLALVIIGLSVVAWPTKFGSDAVPLDHGRTQAPAQTHAVSMPADAVAVSKVPTPKPAPYRLAALSPDDLVPAPEPFPADPEGLIRKTVAAEIASLPEPEGPPLPPPEVPLDAVCHTLASVAQVHGLPTGFFARLIWQESRFRQRAVSPAGAQGVAQFMPAVAAERGLQNPFDPLAALPHSARFLKEHINTFGNIGLAAAAYNGGARRVTEWIARKGRLPEETRNYVKIITGHEPEKWLESVELELPVDLPNRAPCDGVADLSRDAEAAKVTVALEPPIAKLVEDGKIAVAKAAEAAAKARRIAAAKAKGRQILARAKAAKKPAVVADAKGNNAKGSDKPPPARNAETAVQASAAKNSAAKSSASKSSAAKSSAAKASPEIASKTAPKSAPKSASKPAPKADPKSAALPPKIAERPMDASARKTGVKVAGAAAKR
jgi:hypothetical protein